MCRTKDLKPFQEVAIHLQLRLQHHQGGKEAYRAFPIPMLPLLPWVFQGRDPSQGEKAAKDLAVELPFQ